MHRSSVVILVALALVSSACASSPSPGDGAETPPALSVDVSSLPAPTASSTGAEPTEAASDHDACLMLYECGCNSGCIQVEAPRRGLREGDLVLAKTGGLKGKEVWVARSKTADGASILTVQQRDPKGGVEVCRRLGAGNELGYLCATDGFGAARRCSSCPSE